MSKKSKPRHLSGKAKTARKLTPPQGTVPTSVESQPALSPAAPRMDNRPILPDRSVLSVGQAVRPTLAARSRPIRAAAQAVPANCDYVVKDLKRISVIAASLFVIMGILTVVVH